MMGNLYLRFAAACASKGLFGLPPWYKYLDSVTETDKGTGFMVCTPKIQSAADIWLIVAAVIDILLRVSTFVAIGFIVWGGIQFISSQGEPDKTAKARHTVINALIGLVIAVTATTIVSFVAGRFTK